MNLKKNQQANTVKTFGVLIVIALLILAAVMLIKVYGPETKAAAIESKCSQIEMHILRAVASEGNFVFKISANTGAVIKEIKVHVNGQEAAVITDVPEIMETRNVNVELTSGEKIQLIPVLSDGSSCGSEAEITAS